MQAVHQELQHCPFCEEYQWVVSENYCCYCVHYALFTIDEGVNIWRQLHRIFEKARLELKQRQRSQQADATSNPAQILNKIFEEGMLELSTFKQSNGSFKSQQFSIKVITNS